MSSSNPNAQRPRVPGPHRTVLGQRNQVPDPDEGSKSITLPSNPVNPFPYVQSGSWAGITPEAWIEMHTDFLDENPEFKVENFDANGKPEFVQRCIQMWDNDIMNIKKDMTQRKAHPTRRPSFGDRLEGIVRKAGYVDQAVCLALGRFDNVGDKWKKAFKHQLAFFLVLCEMLEKKQGNRIPMVFQDPGFGSSEEYVLSALAGGEVVEHPEALKYMTESSFVFGPFIQHDVFASTILLKRPVLFIGNKIENDFSHPMGRELARRYIRKVYMTADHTFGPDMQEFVRQTDEFHGYYEKDVLDDNYDKEKQLVSAFKNLWVHHPKRQHPQPGVSNVPTFEFATVKSVSTEPYIEHLTASADATSSTSDDTALSNNTEPLCVNSNADSTSNAPNPSLEPSQVKTSGAAHSAVPASQPARPAVGLEGSIHASARRGSAPSTAQSPVNPALNPRNFPYRNKTDKLKGKWGPR